MRFRQLERRYLIAALVAVASCDHSTQPPAGPPAKVEAASPTSRTGEVASALAAPLVVKVKDANGREVAGATVTFAVTQGNGSVSPRVTISDNSGNAQSLWTLGSTTGLNEVSAAVNGVTIAIRFTATGLPGPAATVTVSPKLARIFNGVDTVRLVASSRDAYGNFADPAPTFTVRDPTLVSVTAAGLVRALRRGGSTYVIATSGSRTDSSLVTVLAVGESICTGVVNPLRLSVGQVVTGVSSDLCVRGGTTNEEYALIAYFNSAVPSATTQIETKGIGITPVSLSNTSVTPVTSAPFDELLVPDEAFERALRQREAASLAAAAPAARQWYANRRQASGGAAFSVATAVPTVGELLSYNVNALSDCTNADLRTGRVVAVTNKAIVVADTANPSGGFTDEQYQSFGVTFDTLIDPVNIAAFGAPADFDGNGGRSTLFFTRAVNALTPRGSGSVVLGFFYGRDIRPKSTECPGTNGTKMFYLLVPDTGGVVSDRRSMGTVLSLTNGTIAHEYQHLINATRRLYVNNAVNTTEEAWMNEGLSHIAEELNFFAAAKLQPRANIDAAAMAPSIANGVFQTYSSNNISRYRRYLQSSETQSPTGSDPFDDDLATRGGAWAFLRYVADHVPGSTGDGNLWFRLVNNSSTGIANLTSVLGTSPADLLRDWSISVMLDDLVPGVDSRFVQPSWNFRSALPAGGFTFSLFARSLTDGATVPVTISGGASTYLRFGVAANQDALLTITQLTQAVQPTIRLSIVRTR